MTTYIRRNKGEVLVCDGCGLDHTGVKPDLTGAKPVDFGARMRAAGFPPDTMLKVKDFCPACDRAGKAERKP
jgi:hypothetical protein